MKINPKGSKLFTPKYNLTQTYAKRYNNEYQGLYSDTCHLKGSESRGKLRLKPARRPGAGAPGSAPGLIDPKFTGEL